MRGTDREIESAIERLHSSVFAADAVGAIGQGEEVAKDTIRRIYSGFDLDFVEVEEVMQQRRRVTLMAAMLSGQGPGTIGPTSFLEGIAVGLLIAEARAREEAGS